MLERSVSGLGVCDPGEPSGVPVALLLLDGKTQQEDGRQQRNPPQYHHQFYYCCCTESHLPEMHKSPDHFMNKQTNKKDFMVSCKA